MTPAGVDRDCSHYNGQQPTPRTFKVSSTKYLLLQDQLYDAQVKKGKKKVRGSFDARTNCALSRQSAIFPPEVPPLSH
ncbi:hypothetical protein JYU34_013171 [Plutella xylostella]|uniref:Uncharacterized protein n=1 Tax=Plutella xylostella TaxID=51655 RepID=A0ABQ7QEE3_PLUXY|nr:hypothetical protein JYU34_013171 [Plutella xylostella]